MGRLSLAVCVASLVAAAFGACTTFSATPDVGATPDGSPDEGGGPREDGGAEGAPPIDAGSDGPSCADLALPTPPSRCAGATALYACANFDELDGGPDFFLRGVANAFMPTAAVQLRGPANSLPNAYWLVDVFSFDAEIPTEKATVVAAELQLATVAAPTNGGTVAKLQLGGCDVNIKFENAGGTDRMSVDAHCAGGFYDHHDLTSQYPADQAFHHVTLGLDACRGLARASWDEQAPSVFALGDAGPPAAPAASFGLAGSQGTIGIDDIVVVAK